MGRSAFDPHYGFSYRIVWSEDVFKKFAATYHILLHATLFFLLVILFREGKPEIIDLANFQIRKVSFRSMMGLFAATNASTYLMFRNMYAYYDQRIFEETANVFRVTVVVMFSHEPVRILGGYVSFIYSSGCLSWFGIRKAPLIQKRQTHLKILEGVSRDL